MMPQSTRLIATILLSALPPLASAGAADFSIRFTKAVPHENPKCTCRYKGEHLPLGALRCIQTPDGPRMHECVTEQNVTSWRPGQEPCPQASLLVPRG